MHEATEAAEVEVAHRPDREMTMLTPVIKSLFFLENPLETTVSCHGVINKQLSTGSPLYIP